MAEPKFEVTQILATRFDADNDEWLLVQWGCTWMPRSAMAGGLMLHEYLIKPKLSTIRVHIPIEAGTQTASDADHCRKRDKIHNKRAKPEAQLPPT